MGLALSCLMLLRNWKLFAEDGGHSSRYVLPEEGRYYAFRWDHHMFGNRVEEVDEMGVRFRASKGDQGRKGAIKMRTVNPVSGERLAGRLLEDLTRTQGNDRVPSSLPLIVYRSGRELRVWTRAQATQCL